jgi:hypothetical protein
MGELGAFRISSFLNPATDARSQGNDGENCVILPGFIKTLPRSPLGSLRLLEALQSRKPA